jgi:uncharacterized membrane protein YidH (DUF202 family)
MGIPSEVRLAVSLTLFAIAGITLWRFRYYTAPEEWVRAFGLPPQAPRHVAIWLFIAYGLIIAGALIAFKALSPFWRGVA